MPRPDDVPDLGIDTTPKGPLRLGTRRRPAVPSGLALAWSRTFWGAVGTVAVWLAWLMAGAFLDGIARGPDRAPRPDVETVAERYYRQREEGRLRRAEAERELAEHRAAIEAGR